MEAFKPVITHYTFGGHTIKLMAPEAAAVAYWYQKNPQVPFPFWSRVWPAALGLCHFIAEHPGYVQNKTVLEIAGGLGLPSLLAAHFAAKVIATDLSSDAVALVQQSATLNELESLEAFTLNWNHIPEDLQPDVVLLSDINYDPATFDTLFEVLLRFLNDKAVILLSTPQRLMAKPFIERLLPFCLMQQTETVSLDNTSIEISVLALALEK